MWMPSTISGHLCESTSPNMMFKNEGKRELVSTASCKSWEKDERNEFSVMETELVVTQFPSCFDKDLDTEVKFKN